MPKHLPDAVVKTLRNLVHEAEVNNEIIDAYGLAERIKRAFPDEQLATGELVAEMLNSSLRAIELAPPKLIIEILLPPGTPPEDDATDIAPLKGEGVL